jgi:hypothetical protein
VTTHNARATFIGFCWLIVTFTPGCSRWIEMMAVPVSDQESTSQTIAKAEQVPLIMEHVRITRNGSPQNPSPDTEQRVLSTLQDLGLFSHLRQAASAEASNSEKIVHARVSFDEAIDPHAGDAAWKGIAIGASMFLLTPLIPLEYDYAAHVTLDLERWDGQVKRYESQSAGTVRYHLFGATPIMIDELKGHVTESCLTMLAKQLVHDTPFYFASSAPLSGSTIRTVSVKPKPSSPSASPVPLIPVSTSPGQ